MGVIYYIISKGESFGFIKNKEKDIIYFSFKFRIKLHDRSIHGSMDRGNGQRKIIFSFVNFFSDLYHKTIHNSHEKSTF